MIVADGLAADLLDPRADGRRLEEIHRRSIHLLDFARRNERVIDRRVGVGVQGEKLVENRPIARTCQVEVAVVRQVHDGRLVRGRRVFHL